MSFEGLLLPPGAEDGVSAVLLSVDAGSSISLQVFHTLTNLPTPRRRPCACIPCINIVHLNLVSLDLYSPVSYHSGIPDDSL
jgi:hypothetical protein